MTKTNRTDPHRPGAIVPAEYRLILVYALPSNDGMPPFNTDAVIKLRAETLDARWFGGLGHCGVCGASYIYGALWLHEPTGDYVNMGCDCSEKYAMLANFAELEDLRDRRSEMRATALAKKKSAAERAAFLDARPGLAEDLTCEHPILADLAARFATYRTLSDKQVALARKLADEVRNPAPAEVMTPAPEGKQVVRGRVLSVKLREGDYGVEYKMTVKVETPAGAWLAWGTCPGSILDAAREAAPGAALEWLRGAEVEFSATLTRGQDAHFAMTKRPTKGRVVAPAAR